MKKKDKDNLILFGLLGAGAYLLYRTFGGTAQAAESWNVPAGRPIQDALVPNGGPANPNEVPLATVNPDFPFSSVGRDVPAVPNSISDSDAARALYDSMVRTGVFPATALQAARQISKEFNPEHK